MVDYFSMQSIHIGAKPHIFNHTMLLINWIKHGRKYGRMKRCPELIYFPMVDFMCGDFEREADDDSGAFKLTLDVDLEDKEIEEVEARVPDFNFETLMLSNAPFNFTPSHVAPFLVLTPPVAGVDAPEVLREGVVGSQTSIAEDVEEDDAVEEAAALMSFKRRFGFPSSH